jgi:hypothetical protein
MKNLRISKKFLAIVTACLSLSVFSCKDELSNLDNPPSGGASLDNVSVEQQDLARIQFAKILAKALENKEVRDFVKKESLKMFDNDYDVLYHANKNKLINGTDTFSSILSKSNDLKEGELDKIVNILPKLNILIPDFFTQSANTWDIETDIPLVAVSNSELENKKVDFVRAYDAKANETKLDAHKFPNRVMIVVKNNERIEALNVVKNGRSAIEKERVPYFKEGDTEFFIAGDGFVNKNQKKTNLKVASMEGEFRWYGLNLQDYTSAFPNDGSFFGTIFNNIWERYPEFMLSNDFPFQSPAVTALKRDSQRKSIYYKENGFLNQNVKERLMYCRLTSFSAIQNIAEDWTEGNLELVCEIAMLKVRPGDDFDRKTTYKSVNPNIIRGEFLGSYNGDPWVQYGINNGVLTKITSSGIDQYKNITGIWINWFDEGFTWSPFLYGEQMQYIFYEKDDGAEKIDEYTSSTTVSANFGIGLKDVWNIGGSGSSTNSRKLTIKTTNNSDPLGSYVMQYGQDIGFARNPINIGNLEFITQSK